MQLLHLIFASPRDDGRELEKKYKTLPVVEYLEEVESRRLISKKDAQLVESYLRRRAYSRYRLFRRDFFISA